MLTEGGPLIALAWGLFCATSLVMGAILGMWLKPRNVIIAGLMAFGGGALIAALTLDLVQEGIEKEFGNPHVPCAIWSLALGLIIGGILFVVLDKIINTKGGFLRKNSTASKHIVSTKRKHLRRFVEALGAINAFHHIPAAEIRKIARYVVPRLFSASEVIFKKGDPGDRLYFILQGEVEVTSGELEKADGADAKEIACLGTDDILGEIALLAGCQRTATAVAKTNVRALELNQCDFQHVIRENPKVREALSQLAETRLLDLKSKEIRAGEKSEEWIDSAISAIDRATIEATEEDVRKAAEERGAGAALGIWLGTLLDGIPESLVIGASLIGSSVNPSLVAGIFLSNMPEAMSSSILMRKQNYPMGKVIWMWTTLVIITGLGALMGNIFFEMLPDQVHIMMAGVASGSMLVMVAQTMMPEAFHQGGGVTGLSTLAGFLVAILIKVWTPGGH